jgi:predicted dehydrogenase
MRILIQGAGSTGQRHYRNLSQQGHEVAFLRHSEATRPFVKEFFDRESNAGKAIPLFLTLDEAVSSFRPTALFVCTPNAQHLSDALAGARAGLHLFIEKPVHNTVDGLQTLQRLVADKGLIVQVGYQLRFHPLLAKVKEMVTKGELGRILSAAVEVGENIEDWHPWEDYRETYAPWVRSGGGSLLCFSHDIDYVYWLLGKPDQVHSFGGKITPLEGDAEDLVQSVWRYEDQTTAMLHIDYWQRPKIRKLKLIGTTRTCVWEETAPLSVWEHASGVLTQLPLPEGYERNNMFFEEVKHFVDCVNNDQEPITFLAQSIEVLEIVEQIKHSL